MTNEFLSGEALRYSLSGLPTTPRRKSISNSSAALPLLVALLTLTAIALNIPVSLGLNAIGAVTTAGPNTNVYSPRSGRLTFLITADDPIHVRKGDVIASVSKLDIAGQHNIANLEHSIDVIDSKSALIELRLDALAKELKANEEYFRAGIQEIEKTEAELKRAQAILTKEIDELRTELLRAEESFDKGLVPKSRVQQFRSLLAERLLQNSEFDLKIAAFETSIADYNAEYRRSDLNIEIAMDDANIMLLDLNGQRQALLDSNTVQIKSERIGRIISRGYKIGDLIDGSTPIFHYEDALSTFEFEVDVSAAEIGQVRNGAPANIEINSLPFFDHGFINGHVIDFAGVPTELQKSGESFRVKSNYRVKIKPDKQSIDNFLEKNDVVPGMSIIAHIETSKLPLWKIVFAPLLKFWLLQE